MFYTESNLFVASLKYFLILCFVFENCLNMKELRKVLSIQVYIAVVYMVVTGKKSKA